MSVRSTQIAVKAQRHRPPRLIAGQNVTRRRRVLPRRGYEPLGRLLRGADVLLRHSIFRALAAIAAILLLFALLGAANSIRRGARIDIESLPAEPSATLLGSYVGRDASSSGNPIQSASSDKFLFSFETISYTVKQGDTVSEIADARDLRIDTIISYNSISDVRAIQAGNVLLIPAFEDDKPVDGVVYQVRDGDTLVDIAKSHGVDLNPILDANRLSSEVIRPGDQLFIPSARMTDHDIRKALGTLFVQPVVGELTSRFGMRVDPISNRNSMHYGIDLASATGTPVRASNDGRVKMVGTSRTLGTYVVIDHIDQFQTLYAHLSSVSTMEGARVSQGSIIGKVGNTGYSTGPHLHFSIYKDLQPVDPLAYLR